MIEKKSASVSRALIYFFLVVWALVVLFPFYWMVLTSLKSFAAYNSEYIPRFFTANPTLENYTSAFEAVPLGRYFLNTLIFTVATTGLMMLVIIPAAFAFARLQFKGRNAVFALFLSLMMIPTELVIITGFIGAFKAYSDEVALFGTNLNAAGMNTIVGYVYDMLYGDSGGYPSYAAAAALILFAIVFTITYINLTFSKNKVQYM